MLLIGTIASVDVLYSWGQEKSATGSPSVVEFAQLGSVTIKTSRHANGYPTIIFTDAKGRVLLTTAVGVGNRIFRINPEENRDGRENPIIRFSVVDGPLAKSKVVFAAAMYGGGSDCEYQGTVIGATDGRLRPLLSKQAFANAEGGMYLGDLGEYRGYGFAEWNFIWGSEGHVDPHRFNVKLYRFDPVAGSMVKVADLTSTGSYKTDTEALAEFGLHYPNLLRSFPAFGC
jgi:hypothetical protein